MRLQITAGNAPAEACRAVFLYTKCLQKEIKKLKGSINFIQINKGVQPSTYKSIILDIDGLK